MPRRTNQFQKLVFLVKTHAAAGAVVTESKFLGDIVTGAKREVDICVESTIAGHAVIIALECNGEGRKANVGWVEEMKAKHERLPTSVLVLVSRAGFSKEATKVAASHGIHTLALNAVTPVVTKRLFGSASSLWSKSFTLHPTKVLLEVEATADHPLECVAVSPDNIVYRRDGTALGPTKELVEFLLKADFTVRELGKLGEADHKYFEIHWVPPRDDSDCLCLQKLDPPLLRPILIVKVFGECNFDISEFRLNRGDLGGIAVAWGTGAFLGKKAMLVASDAPTSGFQLSITTDPRVDLTKPLRPGKAPTSEAV